MDAGTRQYVSFVLDGRLYGLDIAVVKEVNPTTTITSAPRSPGHIRGLVNVRGQVVMVIDIAVVFGRAPRPVTEESHIIILKMARELQQVRGLPAGVQIARFGDKPIGFLVDRIGDVISADESELAPAPPHMLQSNARYILGVIRLKLKKGREGPLIVLNAAEML